MWSKSLKQIKKKVYLGKFCKFKRRGRFELRCAKRHFPNYDHMTERKGKNTVICLSSSSEEDEDDDEVNDDHEDDEDYEDQEYDDDEQVEEDENGDDDDSLCNKVILFLQGFF